MRVAIVAIGHKMPAWIRDGFDEYVRRMPPEIRVELVELKPAERGAGKSAARAKAMEGERLLAALPSGATLIALDEKGAAISTQGLATLLTGWMRDGVTPAFVIGGADGLADDVKRRAQRVLSLSALTLPHGLVRVLLAEQLYRAWTILSHHPYHRE